MAVDPTEVQTLPPNPEDNLNAEDEALRGVARPMSSPAPIVVHRTPEMQQLDEDMRYAMIFAASGLFKGVTASERGKSAAQAAVKIIAGRELGIRPMAAMRSIYVFDGQVALSGPLIGALINKSSDRRYEILHTDDKSARIEFFEFDSKTSKKESLGVASFTIAEAQIAGLMSKDNWKHYPTAMLLWRTMSSGAKKYCAHVFNGTVYTPEELNENVVLDSSGNVIGAVATASAAFSNSDPDAEDAEIQAAATELRWTRALLMANLRNAGGDKARLLESMRAQLESQKQSGREKSRREQESPSKETVIIEQGRRDHLFGLLKAHGIEDREERLKWASKVLARKVSSFKSLTVAEADVLEEELESMRAPQPILVEKVICLACQATSGQPHLPGCPIDESDELPTEDDDGVQGRLL